MWQAGIEVARVLRLVWAARHLRRHLIRANAGGDGARVQDRGDDDDDQGSGESAHRDR